MIEISNVHYYHDFCRAILHLLMMSLGTLILSISGIRRQPVQFMVLTRSTKLVMRLEMYCMMLCGKKLGKLLKKSGLSLKRYFLHSEALDRLFAFGYLPLA